MKDVLLELADDMSRGIIVEWLVDWLDPLIKGRSKLPERW